MFEDNFRKVEPYTPGEQTNDPSVVKINTNECPYPPSPEVEKALKNLDLDNYSNNLKYKRDNEGINKYIEKIYIRNNISESLHGKLIFIYRNIQLQN